MGQLYAAEALVHLNRLSDAMHYLKPESVTDVSTTLPDPQRNGELCNTLCTFFVYQALLLIQIQWISLYQNQQVRTYLL